MSTNTSEDLANALRLCLGYLTPPITAGERRAVAAAEAALTSPLPQKERPDFIAGYEAGLADGQRCAERDIAERPAAPESCGHESCDCRGYCQRKQPAAPAVPLTDDEVIDAVRDADLDWHQGWTLEDDGPNRYEQLVRAVERAHGIGPATAAKTRASCGSSCSP